MNRTLFVMSLLLAGCTTTRYVPQIHTEYVDKVVEQVKVDSVTDTRVIYVKGDTVIDWRDRWNTRRELIHDTIRMERTDSIPYPVEVPAQLSTWEQTKVDLGGYAMLALLLKFAYFCLRKWHKNRYEV